jgi:hypothetical protein
MNASRWGAAAIIVLFVVLSAALSGRYHIAPLWVGYVIALVMLVPMALVTIFRSNPVLRRLERITMFCAVIAAFIINTANLGDIVRDLFTNVEMQARPLFTASIGIWAGNALIFTLLYWLIDRGGPDARFATTAAFPDFEFPATQDPSRVPPDWKPGIIDYLFIGFTTNTAFSPTEAMPLSARAKSLVIVQSAISLITIVVVAARAIGM